MYEYKYVETSLGGFFSAPKHREMIDEYAKAGWRLVQVLGTNYDGHGKPGDFEIIFERLVQEE
nr:DUF4177 domain-containing protein [Paenibacillus sp. OV219]